MKKLFYALTAVIITQSTLSISEAAAQTWRWATAFGSGSSTDIVNDLTTDENGNTYVLSQIDKSAIYSGSVIIPNGKGINEHTLITSYNRNGIPRWNKVLSGAGAYPKSIRVTKSGNVFVFAATAAITGYPAYFDTDTTVVAEWRAMSLICYDTMGKFKWIRQPDTLVSISRSYEYQISSMDIDDAGNAYLLLTMPPDNIILGSSLKIPSTPPFRGAGLYVLKYSPIGDLLSVTMLKDFSFVSTYHAVTSTASITYNKFNGGFYITGCAYASPGADSLFIKGIHQDHNIYVASFSVDGSLKWYFTDTLTTGVNNTTIFDAAKLDDSGHLYIGGSGSHSNVINGYAFINPYTSNRVPAMPFIMKTDSNGTLKWCINGGVEAAGTYAVYEGFSIGKNFAAVGVTSGLMNYFGTDPYRDTIKVNVAGEGQDGWFAVVDLKTGKKIKHGRISGPALYDGIAAIDFRGDDLFIAGHFESNKLTMDGSSVTVSPSMWVRDLFITKCDLSALAPKDTPTAVVQHLSTTFRNVSIYPNPANDVIIVDGLEAGTVLSLRNLSGQQLATKTATKSTEQIAVQHLPSGIYLLQSTNIDGAIYNVKIMKQ